MQTSDFDFQVPPELIAHEPVAKRDHSRLMVLHRDTQTIEHQHFYDIVDYLQPGDLLVINNTKVIPANLMGRKEDGGAKVEVLLVKRRMWDVGRGTWECLVKPGKRLKVGSKVIFGDREVVGTVLEKTNSGEQIIEFTGDLAGFMKRSGEIPLPPYIKMKNASHRVLDINSARGGKLKIKNEGNNSELNIRGRYQTVYAEKPGASAAPTAGLHFTPELLEKAKANGVEIAQITLHTGLATFKPVYAEKVEEHKMYAEHYEVSVKALEQIRKAKRVIAVGTTSVRTLETVNELINESTNRDLNEKMIGETNLFIYPGYKFKVVNAMITNFHWPRTSLIMLVSAFAGKDFIMRAYQEAIDYKYRFFSFGDAMLII
jgi:S-adenosylmethionine:tRNA ribosyltransferase-isomerase